MKYLEILDKGNEILRSNNIKNTNLDCELILSKVLNKTREQILTNLNDKIDDNQKKQFIFYLDKRKKKNPISHILGFKFFWKFKFYINQSVLIPRPESEQIVEKALKYIPINKKMNILDIGTGSGCLVISLLKERSNCIATAIDISKEALKVAKINANMYHLENKIKFLNISSKILYLINMPIFLKFKHQKPKNLAQIEKLNEFVRLKTRTLSVISKKK